MLVRRLALAVILVFAATCGDDGDRAASPTPTTSDPARTSTSPTTSTTTLADITTTIPVPSTAAPQPAAGSDFSCPPIAPRAEPRPDRPRHTLDIRVDVAGRSVIGTLNTIFAPDIATDRLVYRLWPAGPRPASGGAAIRVPFVTVNGQAVAAQRPEATRLEVPVPGGLSAGETVEARVDFELDLPGTINDRIASGDGWVRLGSFYPTLEWQPGLGWNTEPPTSGFAEASVSPTADYVLRVQVPEGFDVLASGVAVGPGEWRAEAVRDVALTVGRFATATATAGADAGRPVEVVVAAHDGIVDPNQFATKIAGVLEDMARRYGAYPWPRYTLAVTPGLSGGIEYPMHVLQGPETLGRTTTHEVAHMWFYGLVGNHQGVDPWLDEGLASWAEAVVEGSLGSMRSTSIPAAGRGRLGEPMTYWARQGASYYRSVYVQGAQALDALGDVAAVDCVLAHHVAKFAHRIATPEEFGATAEAVIPGARATLNRYGAGV